ncbi:protein lifeguard 1 [Mastacembelus armatus]|uniref:Si:ch211-284o19.8 n=1 Tax=Mastacembelus armatus TaxID=205130 RepID=A0A7N8XDH8_9TELE|nr:protein lifeguard 1-like [Mastacembelus armatus]
MSVSDDTIATEKMQAAPESDPSTPLSKSQEEQPPPYCENPVSEAPEMYSPSKTEMNEVPGPGCEPFADTSPEAQSDRKDSSAFEDKTVRRGFVRKVFCILTLQLVFTFTVVCVFTFSTVVKEAVKEDIWAYVSSFIVFGVVAVTLSLCPSLSRRHPWNIVALAVVTLSLSYVVGTIASYHETNSVIVTMGATLVISLAIIAFSAQTRYDFTFCHGFLLVLVVDLIMFGFFCTFYYSYIADVCYGCLGALLYSLFLMIDCQLMMGKMSYRLDPEEYVNAALMIYLDIVLIFLYLLGRR